MDRQKSLRETPKVNSNFKKQNNVWLAIKFLLCAFLLFSEFLCSKYILFNRKTIKLVFKYKKTLPYFKP